MSDLMITMVLMDAVWIIRGGGGKGMDDNTLTTDWLA
jgi:hypothetical protein